MKGKSSQKVILFETKKEIESARARDGGVLINDGFGEQLADINFALTQTHCWRDRKI